jgi:hypothetical protein
MTQTTTTNPHPDVPLPAFATWVDDWAPEDYRIIHGPEPVITDAPDLDIWTSAIQLSDGSINGDPSEDEPPTLHVAGVDLNTDQMRELASWLLETAAEMDGWAGK